MASITTPSNIYVSFRHLAYVFSDEQLMRYGSPYFDAKMAGIDLLGMFRSGVKEQYANTSFFDRRHLIAANETFPESALADPIADLEVWDDWRTGLRSFPYPGTYSRLGITQQESKTSATSSVGVLGEIMAGLYAQAGISPWVLVRVIRHWPDFIFVLSGGRYAFVEAKAFTGDDASKSTQGIPNKLLAECLVTAIHQLNADPYVQVWGAFTQVARISPLELRVTFLELDTHDDRRAAFDVRVLPDPIVGGLAERALNGSLRYVEESLDRLAKMGSGAHVSKAELRELQTTLVSAAMRELETMLIEEELKVAMLASRDRIEKRVQQMVKKLRPNENLKKRRLFDVLGDPPQSTLTRVRTVGAGALYAGKLTDKDYFNLSSEWSRNWSSAIEPWGTTNEIPMWRCGGAVLCVGDKELEGSTFRIRSQ